VISAEVIGEIAAVISFCKVQSRSFSSEPAKYYALFSVFVQHLSSHVQIPKGLYAGQNPIHAVPRLRAPRTRSIIVPTIPGSRIMMFTKNDIPSIVLIKLSALPIFFCIEFLRN